MGASLAVLMAAGCGGGDSGTESSSGEASAKGATVALLLPENKTARYEARDRPVFTAALKQACPACKVLYSNAAGDAAKQQAQADAALANGAKVLVLDPVDSDAAAGIVQRAKQQGAMIISYDRLVNNADVDYVVKFDNVKQGVVQAQALVDRLKQEGEDSASIVMINGAPTDANAKPLKRGAHSVIDKSGLNVAKEYDTPDWSPDKAQTQMEQAITELGKSRIQGVYVANDGMASGAIAALKGAGVRPLPPVTGLDAEPASIERILRGEQYMTVYLNVEKEARTAARLARALAQGKPAPAGVITGKLNNGTKDVPGALLEPTPVRREDIKKVIVDSGYLKPTDICSGSARTACSAAGIL
jgi:D-xylose transport system substrate-binding protein